MNLWLCWAPPNFAITFCCLTVHCSILTNLFWCSGLLWRQLIFAIPPHFSNLKILNCSFEPTMEVERTYCRSKHFRAEGKTTWCLTSAIWMWHQYHEDNNKTVLFYHSTQIKVISLFKIVSIILQYNIHIGQFNLLTRMCFIVVTHLAFQDETISVITFADSVQLQQSNSINMGSNPHLNVLSPISSQLIPSSFLSVLISC